jgi:hypothetical protein
MWVSRNNFKARSFCFRGALPFLNRRQQLHSVCFVLVCVSLHVMQRWLPPQQAILLQCLRAVPQGQISLVIDKYRLPSFWLFLKHVIQLFIRFLCSQSFFPFPHAVHLEWWWPLWHLHSCHPPCTVHIPRFLPHIHRPMWGLHFMQVTISFPQLQKFMGECFWHVFLKTPHEHSLIPRFVIFISRVSVQVWHYI